MRKEGVSELLYSVIQKLMKHQLFKDFLLGGGTNLAIKYNHRVSTDIDLFSTEIVGTKHLSEICDFFEDEFGKENITINKKNFGSEQLAHLAIFLKKEQIKIDIIQNLKLLYEPTTKNHIRLINDNDIGALKLLAAADRGNQKDFYDLFLLTDIQPLSFYYKILRKRQETFSKDSDKNIFDIQNGKPIDDLKTSLTSLGDFSNAGDKKNPGNRIILTENSPIKIDWPILRKKWLERVEEFAKEAELKFKRTELKRKLKGIYSKFRL
jgi:predicted nucleotidyltransferase component of viral defense system